MSLYKFPLSFLLLFTFIFVYCNTGEQFTSPVGYDFVHPEKTNLSTALNEISGIAFINGNDQTLIAIEDETGKLYSITLGNKKITHFKYGGKADYEDVTVSDNTLISVLVSNGTILQFPASEIGKDKSDSIHEYKNLLPKAEYEGMFASGGKLYVLCKDCPGDKEKKEVSLYILNQSSSSSLIVSNTIKLKISKMQDKEMGSKVKFKPSAIAKHPLTHDWYILSSVNKALLVFDEAWKMKAHYPLNPSQFQQPEGLAFNSKGDMYISNEAAGGTANILAFPYHP